MNVSAMGDQTPIIVVIAPQHITWLQEDTKASFDVMDRC